MKIFPCLSLYWLVAQVYRPTFPPGLSPSHRMKPHHLRSVLSHQSSTSSPGPLGGFKGPLCLSKILADKLCNDKLWHPERYASTRPQNPVRKSFLPPQPPKTSRTTWQWAGIPSVSKLQSFSEVWLRSQANSPFLYQSSFFLSLFQNNSI